jgi:hypothetical protein
MNGLGFTISLQLQHHFERHWLFLQFLSDVVRPPGLEEFTITFILDTEGHNGLILMNIQQTVLFLRVYGRILEARGIRGEMTSILIQ